MVVTGPGRTGPGPRVRTGAGDRSGMGEGAGTVVRTGPGRTDAGAVDLTTFAGGGAIVVRAGAGVLTGPGRTGAFRTRVGAGGATVEGAGTSGGAVTTCMTASCFTITGVPGAALLKKTSAIPFGRRMQP